MRVDRVVTSGTFSLDGGEWEVDNNVWLVGDDNEVIVIDTAHQAQPIIDEVAGRQVLAIVVTHGHNDHITVAPQLAEALDAPIWLHPGDQMLWDQTHPGVAHRDLADGQEFAIAQTTLRVINTPGHSPGSCVLYSPEAGELFSGDTLFCGGPGAMGRSFSDFDTIVDSIRDKILTLPAATRVRTGHGESTSVSQGAPHLAEWIARGH